MLKIGGFLTNESAENNICIRGMDQPYEGDTHEQQT